MALHSICRICEFSDNEMLGFWKRTVFRKTEKKLQNYFETREEIASKNGTVEQIKNQL